MPREISRIARASPTPTNQLPSGILRCIYSRRCGCYSLAHSDVLFFLFSFFFTKGVSLASPRSAVRFGSVRRGEPLNRARNIDSQFGSEQKSGKSVSSLLQPRLIFLPTRPISVPRSFLLPCPSIWTSLSRDMALLACSREGFSTSSFYDSTHSDVPSLRPRFHDRFCYFVPRFVLFFFLRSPSTIVYAFDGIRDVRFFHHIVRMGIE